MPDLIRMMKDEKGLPQYQEIANTLGAIGPCANDALPELRKLLDHKEIQVALAAKKAISQIEFQK